MTDGQPVGGGATTRLARWLDRRQPSEAMVLGGTAVVLGAGAGLGVWLFTQAIDGVQAAAIDGLAARLAMVGAWTVALVPAAAGLVVGLIVHVFVGEERHHGVAGVVEAVALAGGRLRYWRMPAKAVAAAVSIGGGASVGPEDPSVQIGSSLGSMFGQLAGLSDERVRVLVAAGAASGVAAAFNAPIAGVFFALEVVLGEIASGPLGVVVLAAVVASVVSQALAGADPAFAVPAYALRSAAELPLYLVLGLIAGPLAALYIRLVYGVQGLFAAWRAPRPLKTAAAGLAVGVVAIRLPQVMGVGYGTIGTILAGHELAGVFLVAVLAAKLLLTPTSLAGGFVGGVFAPALFLGATLGAAFGGLADRLMPGLGIAPPAFALVGMAAVLAGTVHAPLTAILLLFEMTNDYRIILPLMFAVVVSLVVSQRLQRESVYTQALARKGLRIQRGRDVDVLEGLHVGEVMTPAAVALRESDSLDHAAALLMAERVNGLPVVDDAGALAGILAVQDIDAARAAGLEAAAVGWVCTRDVLVAYPDETIGAAGRGGSARR